MANWYVSSVKYALVPVWTPSTNYTVGQIVRQTAPSTSSNARCFRCSVAGHGGGTEPTWNLTKNSSTVSSSATFVECSGQAAYNGDGGGSAWGAPMNTLAGAMANTATDFFASGDTIYIDSAHTITTGQSRYRFGGTAAAPMRFLSVNSSVVPPTTLAAGAVETSPTDVTLGDSIDTFAYIYGLRFVTANIGMINTGQSIQNNKMLIFDTCTFQIGGNNSASRMAFGALNYISGSGSAKYTQFDNCAFVFSNVGQRMILNGGDIIWNGGSIGATGSVPTTLLNLADIPTGGTVQAVMNGVDLSALSGTLMAYGTAGTLQLKLNNCRTHASATKVSGTRPAQYSSYLAMESCDSSSASYRFYKDDYTGTITEETTIDRVAGASDGTTLNSAKVVTTANCNKYFPCALQPIEIWNDLTGSAKNVQIEIAGAAALNNGDIWMDVEYLGNASYPITSKATTRVLLGTTTNYTTSSESWNGSPATKQYMNVSITPQMKGLIVVKVFVAKASTTVYIDPLITVT